MPAADFAAAQQRIAARRAQRAHHDTRTSTPSRAPSRLPFPFGRLSTTGFSAWDLIKGREGTRPEFRVGQVDAELLDEELLGLLKGQVGEGLKYFGTHITDNWTPEILLALRCILFKLSIWDQNASYGAHLQGLRYTDARSNAPNRPPPKPWQKAAYGVLTIGGRYAWTKWEEWLLSNQEDYTRSESPQLKLMAALTERLTSAHDVASLASFLVFLVNGRYRTITDRLLRLRLTPTSHSTSREVSFEYLNRQLVWHAFTEFLLFLLPLVGISRWRRILSRAFRKLQSSLLSLLGRSATSSPEDSDDKPTGALHFLPERTCAICYSDQNPTTTSEADIMSTSLSGGGIVGSSATDITNPYETIPCGCIYCFACIAQRIANEEGEGWTCLRCGETVKECKPWTGDIIEPVRRTPDRPVSSGKSVGFAARDEKEELREVDPMPDDEGVGVGMGDDEVVDQTRGLDIGASLAWAESEEWARASEERSSSSEGEEDTQSEEYEEDEDELGSDSDQ
jgi:peroxin-2